MDMQGAVNQHVLDLPHLPCHAGYLHGSVADGSAPGQDTSSNPEPSRLESSRGIHPGGGGSG